MGMTQPGSGPEYSPRRAREGVNNSIRRKNRQAIWMQRAVVGASLGLGALCVGLQENDAAEWIAAPAAAAFGVAAVGANAQKRIRLQTGSMARDYIDSLDPLNSVEPEAEESVQATEASLPHRAWHDFVFEYSAGASVSGAVGAYLAPTELIHNIPPANGIYSPGIFLIAGCVVAQTMTERSIHAHERVLMGQMDAAESQAA